MNVRMLIAPALLAAVLAACGGAATSEPTPEPTAGSAATATPPGERGIATGQVASGKALRSSDGRLVISGTGKAPLDVTVRCKDRVCKVFRFHRRIDPYGEAIYVLAEELAFAAEQTGARPVATMDDAR